MHVGFGQKHPDAREGETHVHLEISVGDDVAFTSAVGDGPVHAMDVALRSLIDKFYPQLDDVRLVDYKVRVMSSASGTDSIVRVLIPSSDGGEVWGTVGASPNIIQASWKAMVDSISYKLSKEGVAPFAALPRPEPVAETPRAPKTSPHPPKRASSLW